MKGNQRSNTPKCWFCWDGICSEAFAQLLILLSRVGGGLRLGVLWIGFNLLVSSVIELDRPLCRVVGSALLLFFFALLLFLRALGGLLRGKKVDVLRTPFEG